MIVKHKADEDFSKRHESYNPLEVTQRIVNQHIYDHLQVNVVKAMDKGITELHQARKNLQNFMDLIEEFHQKKESLAQLTQRLDQLIAEATQEKNDIQQHWLELTRV